LLKLDVADRFPLEAIVAAAKLVRDLAAATVPGNNLAEIRIAKSEFSRTVAGHTFLWWIAYTPRYKGKWDHLYQLARCWRLTDSKDLEAFKRLVRKVKPAPDPQGGTWILRCPPWALS
jgi:hypothetical protein